MKHADKPTPPWVAIVYSSLATGLVIHQWGRLYGALTWISLWFICYWVSCLGRALRNTS